MKVTQKRKSYVEKKQQQHREEMMMKKNKKKTREREKKVRVEHSFISYIICTWRKVKSKKEKNIKQWIDTCGYTVLIRCVREYVFLIEKETNAYTLMPIKIHLVEKPICCFLLPEIDSSLNTFSCLLCILAKHCEFNQDENGIIKQATMLPSAPETTTMPSQSKPKPNATAAQTMYECVIKRVEKRRRLGLSE